MKLLVLIEILIICLFLDVTAISIDSDETAKGKRSLSSKPSYLELDHHPSKMRKAISRDNQHNNEVSKVKTNKSKKTNEPILPQNSIDDMLRSYGIKIEKSIPFHSVKYLCFGLASAFNAGDIMGVSELTASYMRPDIQFRKYSNINTTISTSTGHDGVVNFYQSLLNIHPDGVLTVKSINYGVEAGLQVIRCKIGFIGTVYDVGRYNGADGVNITGECEEGDDKKLSGAFKCVTKVYTKIYLDHTNRVIICDQTHKVSLVPIELNLIKNLTR
jgi:hypothetical protein